MTADSGVANPFDSEDIEFHLKLLTLLDNPAVIVAAAAADDPETLRKFLVKHPTEVRTYCMLWVM